MNEVEQEPSCAEIFYRQHATRSELRLETLRVGMEEEEGQIRATFQILTSVTNFRKFYRPREDRKIS